MCGPDWLQPMVEAMESDTRIGWVSAMENGTPVLEELIEAHRLSRQYRVDPARPFTTDAIHQSITNIYSPWDGHESFCRQVRKKGLPLFIPFQKERRSAVCFMIRPAMVAQIGFFDEDFAPIGIAEDLEYFLRMEQILRPAWLTPERYAQGREVEERILQPKHRTPQLVQYSAGAPTLKAENGRRQERRTGKPNFENRKKYFTVCCLE